MGDGSFAAAARAVYPLFYHADSLEQLVVVHRGGGFGRLPHGLPVLIEPEQAQNGSMELLSPE